MAKGTADVIKDLEMGDYPELSKWALNEITSILISVLTEGDLTAEEGDVMVEAEIGEMSFEDGGRAHKPKNTGDH